MKKLMLAVALLFSTIVFSQTIYDTTTLRNRINLQIVPNGTNAITGQMLNQILNGFLNTYPNNRIRATYPLVWDSVNRTLSFAGSMTGVPTSRTLSINGTTYDLTGNRTWTVGSVRSVTFDYGLTGGTITNTGTVKVDTVVIATRAYAANVVGYTDAKARAAFSGATPITVNNTTGVISLGTVPISKGGTNLTSVGTAGQLLRSTGTGLQYFTPPYLVAADISSITYTFTSGLLKTGSTVIALKDAELWNADRLRSVYISTNLPTSSQILQYTGGLATWVNPATIVSQGGGFSNTVNVVAGYGLTIPETAQMIGSNPVHTPSVDTALISTKANVQMKADAINSTVITLNQGNGINVTGTAGQALNSPPTWSLKLDTAIAATKNLVLYNYVPNTDRGANNGIATLDAGGKVPFSQLPAALMIYKGMWNPNTNTPTLADGTGTAGWVYKVSADGSANLGSGAISFLAGDFVIHNGTTWERSVGTDNVVSVNGQQGVISLTTTNIPEGTAFYFTDARARAAISLTTSGSGAATYSSTTGILNVPTLPDASATQRGAVNTNYQEFSGNKVFYNGNDYTVSIYDHVQVQNISSTGYSLLDWNRLMFGMTYLGPFMTLQPPTVTTNRVITLPDASGTLALENANTTGTASNVTGIIAVVNGGSGTNTSTGTGPLVLATAPALVSPTVTGLLTVGGATFTTSASGTLTIATTTGNVQVTHLSATAISGFSSNLSFKSGSSGTDYMRLYTTTTGNLVLQNGGTITDNGVDRLQVNGSALVSTTLYANAGTFTTSVKAGTTTYTGAFAAGTLTNYFGVSANGKNISFISDDATAGNQNNFTIGVLGANNALGPLVTFQKGRGGNAAVSTNDYLGELIFQGANGSAVVTGAQIDVVAQGTWTTSSRPTGIIFSVTASGSTVTTEALKINADRSLIVGGGTATITAAGAASFSSTVTAGGVSAGASTLTGYVSLGAANLNVDLPGANRYITTTNYTSSILAGVDNVAVYYGYGYGSKPVYIGSGSTADTKFLTTGNVTFGSGSTATITSTGDGYFNGDAYIGGGSATAIKLQRSGAGLRLLAPGSVGADLKVGSLVVSSNFSNSAPTNGIFTEGGLAVGASVFTVTNTGALSAASSSISGTVTAGGVSATTASATTANFTNVNAGAATVTNNLTASTIAATSTITAAGLKFSTTPETATAGTYSNVVIDANGKIQRVTPSTLPYTLYAAKISQTGTGTPTVDATMVNQLSGTPTFARTGVGTYRITLTGAFTLDKTQVFMTNGESAGGSVLNTFEVSFIDVDTIEIRTKQYSSGAVALSDSRMNKALIQILVFP